MTLLVGVMADSHDRIPTIHAALDLFQKRNVEAIVHAGDFVAPFAIKPLLSFEGPLHVVFGNNDGERAGIKRLLPHIVDGPLFIPLGGRTTLVHHFIDWCQPEDIARAEVVITGHTHEVSTRLVDGQRLLNPGECCGWVTGRCTVAILDTVSLEVEIVELSG
ncbi:MAG: metallophosphoesterase [Phycisphaerae bacterium]